MVKQQYLVLYIESGIKKYEMVSGKYNLKEFYLDLSEETVKDEDIEIMEINYDENCEGEEIDFDEEFSIED